MPNTLAHIASDGREQTVAEHLHGTAQLAAQFAAPFGGELWGELCGLSHDIGKYSEDFQRRIRGSSERVDHSTKGSRLMLAQNAAPAAFCVAGHHGGLPDGGEGKDSSDEPTLSGRMKRDIPVADGWESDITLPATPPLHAPDAVSQAFFTRMLFSCLVDADFLDTEAFMNNAPVRKGNYPSLNELLLRLNAYIEKKGFLKPQSPVNEHRAEVLHACLGGGDLEKGLFSLTVPTGGGKTVASLAFALSHAARHGMQRVIYVIPYCSIIDQTASVFRDVLGSDCVLEHHSGATYELDANGCISERDSKRALAAENWDMPIVVTTSVQFFESLYANKPSACRKLHNIASSVVIFDEAQTLPIPCLMPCVSAIGQLASAYNVSAVLCTATQPALDDLFHELAPALTRRELCPDVAGLFTALRRTTIVQEDLLSDDDLAVRLQQHEQALCIVSSRKAAHELFAKLTGEGNIHLSTLMYPAHRAALIEDIRARLKAGHPCRVVATSLIEAGVDVDFPAVYRARAGLDSILQAAGRCNREGRRDATGSVVTVYRSEHKTPKIFSANLGAFDEIAAYHSELNTPEAVGAYFKALLSLKGDSALDTHDVLKGFATGLGGSIFPFRTVAERFQMIDTTAKTVYIPKPQSEALIAQLRAGNVTRGLFRELGRYGVSVYPQHFNALARAGDIETLDEYTGILCNSALYDDHMGLSLTADEGKALWI